MAKIFHKQYNIKLPKSQHAVQELETKKGLMLCKKCRAVYFKKSWHHSLEDIDIPRKVDWPIKFIFCPACQMIKDHQYEGRLIIKNINNESAGNLENLIRGFCQRAFERDPLDRLIIIKKLRNKKLEKIWEITVTENQLANKLANKIKDTFNKVKINKKFSADPSDITYITVEFG